ncbi:MAG: hypothetical protein CHACPFDD_01007 [Phycisphaerae bacterium]|nr:hypothetical protein [Phycisphaerae bacterium]
MPTADTDVLPPQAPPIDACRARYLANLAALYRVDPPLAATIDGLPFASLPPVELARDGRLTARLIADDGKPIYAHSRYEPGREAQSLVEAIPEVDSATFVVTGVGLGHHVRELERRFERPLLIIAEDDLSLLKAALCAVDLAEPIAQRRLLIVPSAEKSDVHARLTSCNAPIMLGTHFVTPPHARRYHAAFQAKLREEFASFVAYCRLQMITLLHNARITCRNIAANLPHYLANPGVEVLAGGARGRPAILVAAGPSLARNVHLLRELRGRAVIIAAQTVFKTLLAQGCPPHFVTSLDFHEVSAEFFRGVEDVQGCTLVAEPKATWHVLDAYPGRRHVLHSVFADDLLRDAAPSRGRLRAGATVAHLSFYLAEQLGCDPIILIGQDLAYSDGLYYPPGMPIEEIWSPELDRFCTVEMKQWERIARFRPILHHVKDVHGRETYTDDQLLNYAQQFQIDFAASPARVIHACEGGMQLSGVECMTLRDAAERWCRGALPDGLFGESGVVDAGAAFAAARAALAERQREVSAIRDICTQMLKNLERLVGLVERPDEFNRVVVQVDALRVRIQAFERTYRMVVDVSQQAELRRFAADRRMSGTSQETAASARRRLERDRDFVAALRDGCDYLGSLLDFAAGRLEAA